MSDHVREKAVHAADILNDLIGDLVGGTMLFRYWITEFQAGRVPETLMVNVQKICVSHLVLGLFKFTEFYQRFNQVIPQEHSETCKALLAEINRKGAAEFRNKCVGHIWDNEQQRPLIQSEIMTRLDRLTGGDMPGFLNWINKPTPDESPSTVVTVVETVRDALMSEYSISSDEFIDR
ncbi:MAG TPA: hypothetical protein VFA61_01750 [Candidatus Udaeobacter sp.]|nr:hypothetical protein [Candidatus Udaeobacter sp.]